MLLIGTDFDVDLLVGDPVMNGYNCRRMRTWPLTWICWVWGRPPTVNAAFPLPSLLSVPCFMVLRVGGMQDWDSFG